MNQSVALACSAIMSAAAMAAGGGPLNTTYTFEVLVDRGSVSGLSETGFVVGRGELGPNPIGQDGFFWSRQDGFTVLPLQDGPPVVIPRGVTDDGMVVGIFRPTGVQNDERAVVFAAGSFDPLLLTDLDFSAANTVDAAGRIYGQASIPSDAYGFGTIDSPDENQLLEGVDSSVALGSGTDFAVGAVDARAAVIRPDGTFDFLPDPGTLGGFISRSSAVAVNSSGVYVGNIVDTLINGELRRPVVWDQDGNPTVLPSLVPSFSRVQARDIDNAGVVVGSSTSLSSGDSFATLWIDAVPFDLNSFVDTPSNIILIDAVGINESGVIIGNFVDTTLPFGSAQGAFVLTPVAEPCPADVNGDGSVDLEDLNLVLANFGQATSAGDTDGSGTVDLLDLNAVLASFGDDCP